MAVGLTFGILAAIVGPIVAVLLYRLYKKKVSDKKRTVHPKSTSSKAPGFSRLLSDLKMSKMSKYEDKIMQD